jgi:endo-beta-N-acetylglucosaminidase D
MRGAVAAAALIAAAPAAGQGAPLSLTIDELLRWTPDEATADPGNVARVTVARRFVARPLRRGAAIDPQVRVLYAPDGMNDLGGERGRQARFNGYVFTHWPQIDTLAWFAGTADRGINLPSRGWVEAAHRNGVEVIGTVFFAPVAWGGSPETVASFLRRDAQGLFPAARQLVRIARHYGFDGWFVNAETAGADGAAMIDFMAELRAVAPPEMTIHWYDALLPDGRVRWQNALTPANVRFLQDGARRTADAMFLNYDWTRAGLAAGAALAERMGRSRYDVFIGADLWPARDAQPAFRNSGWLDALRERPGGRAYGSIALFAPHFGYSWPGDARTPRFSDFAQDPRDVARFEDAERRLFAGDGRDLGRAGGAGWPGVASLAPTKGLVLALPFTTSFNTGHGRVEARGGSIVGGPWHDMARQDALPTWQFATLGQRPVTVGYDYDAPFQGGSSLRIAPQAAGGQVTVPLYALRLARAVTVTAVTRGGAGYAVRVGRSSRPVVASAGWRQTRWCVRPGAGEVRVSVIVRRAARHALHLGQLSVEAGCRD